MLIDLDAPTGLPILKQWQISNLRLKVRHSTGLKSRSRLSEQNLRVDKWSVCRG